MTPMQSSRSAVAFPEGAIVYHTLSLGGQTANTIFKSARDFGESDNDALVHFVDERGHYCGAVAIANVLSILPLETVGPAAQ